jgi:hypothetical protein
MGSGSEEEDTLKGHQRTRVWGEEEECEGWKNGKL